jgi:hypothetical protein
MIRLPKYASNNLFTLNILHFQMTLVFSPYPQPLQLKNHKTILQLKDRKVVLFLSILEMSGFCDFFLEESLAQLKLGPSK